MLLKSIEINGIRFFVRLPDGCDQCNHLCEGLGVVCRKKFSGQKFGIGLAVVECSSIRGVGRKIGIKGSMNGIPFESEKNIELCYRQ